MRKIWSIAVLALALTGCASEVDQPPPPPPPSRPAPPPPPPPPPADECGAAAAQRYVGKNRSEIPVPVNPTLQRVACTTCPVTMDFNPRRLNFFFDAQTGVIKEVKCG